jgi:hypothetical protein
VLAILDPVCGCEGKTYVNARLAERAGVSYYTYGECTPNPLTTMAKQPVYPLEPWPSAQTKVRGLQNPNTAHFIL